MQDLALMIGLWVVTIATVPVYYWWKILKRKNCDHTFINIRYCPGCGKREKEVKQDE